MNARVVPTAEEFAAQWIPRLPQVSQIRTEDALRWRERTAGIDPGRFEWHYQRLFGFGGSDVGEIGAWELGVPALFNTVDFIVEQKLLQRAIEPANKYTRRGTLLEDDWREMFLEDFGARQREDLTQALRSARSSAHPWARANPDDVVEMSSGGKTKLFIVDYKAASHTKETAPTQYACQTHHYDWLLWTADHDGEPRLAGDVPLATDGLLIVYYDYAAAEIVPITVPWDGAVLRSVITGGDKVWEHILGEHRLDFHPQEVDESTLETLSAEELAQVAAMESQIVACKLLADELYERYESLKVDCEKLMYDTGRRRKSKIRPPFSRMSVSYQPIIDAQRLEQLCRLAQVDTGSLQIPTKLLDAEAMAARLRALGEKPLYQTALDMKRVSALCAAHAFRIPLDERGVWRVSTKRSNQEALKPVRDHARSEAAKALRGLLDIMAVPGVPPTPASNASEVIGPMPRADAAASGVRRLILPDSRSMSVSPRRASLPRRRQG